MYGEIMKKKGFTLIELMIVVAIIGILAAIAYPSYSTYSERIKRVEAQTLMQEMSQKLVAYKITNGSFKDVKSANVISSQIPLSGTVNYTVNITDIDGKEYSATTKNSTWLITATPEGAMANTGSLTLDSKGVQCWNKVSGACSAWQGK